MTRSSVVLVPFPFDDLSTAKVRPAVCLTEPVGPHRHVVLAFITSRAPDIPLDTDLALDPADADFGTTGLRAASTIRLHRLMTVSTSLIQRWLGQLPSSMQAAVDDRLRALFGL